MPWKCLVSTVTTVTWNFENGFKHILLILNVTILYLFNIAIDILAKTLQNFTVATYFRHLPNCV